MDMTSKERHEEYIKEKDIDELVNRFTYHAPTNVQKNKYQHLRKEAFHLAMMIREMCPNSREKSLAQTKLEEVIMWANAAIARNE